MLHGVTTAHLRDLASRQGDVDVRRIGKEGKSDMSKDRMSQNLNRPWSQAHHDVRRRDFLSGQHRFQRWRMRSKFRSSHTQALCKAAFAGRIPQT
jgi:hypothetical protein